MLAPIVHEIARKYEGKLRVGLLDSDANPDIVMQYGVMGLPTLLLFIDGRPVERIVGYTPRERVEAKLLPHLAVNNA
jgi:thioredoxin 1